MKIHKLFLFLFIGCLLYGCKEKSNTVTITGQLEGVEDNTVITLYEFQGNMFNPLVNDTVIDGRFTFLLPDSILQTTRELAIMSNAAGFPPTWLSLWVSPGDKVKITGEDKLLRTWQVASRNPLQKELNRYNDGIREYVRDSQIAMTKAYAYFDSIDVMPERRQEFREEINTLYALNDSLTILQQNVEMAMLSEHKTYSDVWMNKLNQYSRRLRFATVSDEERDLFQALYNDMPDHLKKSELGESLYLSLNQPKVVGVGDEMADMDMWDVDGNLCRLENYKGKYILLDFWSSGCGPCIMSIPEMREIAETYKDKLTIVSISSDTKEIWTNISKEKNITWTNLNDFKGDNGIKLHYGVRGIPNYFIISPEGKIIESWMGYGEGLLKKKMQEFIL